MNRRARCILGVIFGMMLGFAYGIVSQWINSIFLPSVPLYAPPPGRFESFLIDGFGGGLLGFLVAWPGEILVGVILSALTGTIASSLMSASSAASNSERLFGVSALLFLTFLPRVVLFLPVVSLVRWVIHVWEEETLYATFSLQRRLRSVAILVVVSLAAGLFSLYPSITRKSLTHLNGLILSGRQATSLSSLPQPLQKVNGFLKYSESPYTLKVIENADDIPVQRPITGFNEIEPAIEVFFTNGFHFGCVYTPPNEQPNCVDY